MRIQGVNITYSKLKELLELPDEAQIVSVERREDHPRTFQVHIEHPALDEYDEECQIATWDDLKRFLGQFKEECCR